MFYYKGLVLKGVSSYFRENVCKLNIGLKVYFS